MKKLALAKENKFRLPIWILRLISVVLIASVIVAGTACKSGHGRLCIFENNIFGITCPLGYLGAVLASKNILPYLLPSVGAAILLIVLFGRFFCAWVCPVSIVQILKSKIHLKGIRIIKTNQRILNSGAAGLEKTADHSFLASKPVEKTSPLSGLALLAGALASSFLFGFPVFCLVCPVGLTFGAIFAAVRLFSGGQPGWELLIFPIILILELYMFRNWCHSLCPLGALHSLISRFNLLVQPKVKKETCLVSQGINCRVCEKVCPQGVNLGKLTESTNSKGCTKCFECYEKCPVNAIQIKLL